MGPDKRRGPFFLPPAAFAASAAVVDNEGEQLTAMTFEAEQCRQIKAIGQPVAGPTNVPLTALPISIQGGEITLRA